MLSKFSKIFPTICSGNIYIPYFKLSIPFFSRFNLNRDVESQLNEMRRPLLNQMVELWKTMGLTHLQEARIDPMLGYFKGKYLLCTNFTPN